MRAREALYRLLFTRDDDLDLLQVLFLVIVSVTLAIVWRLAMPGTAEAVVIEGLVTLRWLVGLLVVTAVPKWMAPMLAARALPDPAAKPAARAPIDPGPAPKAKP